MKTIFEVAKEKRIVISIPDKDGHHRLAAEIFPYKDGAVFFDIGWNQSSGHPIHIIPGPISEGTDYWEFGDYEKDGDWAAWVYEEDTDTSLNRDFNMWAAYLETEEGQKEASHEKAVEQHEKMMAELKRMEGIE